MATTEYLVSRNGQMSVPAEVRHRWGLDDGGPITVFDLGDAILLLPASGRRKLLEDSLTNAEHLTFVASFDDPDLATT